jgi:hypothetical protein
VPLFCCARLAYNYWLGDNDDIYASIASASVCVEVVCEGVVCAETVLAGVICVEVVLVGVVLVGVVSVGVDAGAGVFCVHPPDCGL